MAPRSLALLRARSRIADAEPPPTAPTPEVRPDQGHHSARLVAGVGMTGDRPFAELALRPAYHDLLDPVGYVPGAAIDFLEMRALVRRRRAQPGNRHFDRHRVAYTTQ